MIYSAKVTKRAPAAILLSAVLLLRAPSVAAQEPNASDKALAESLFQQGRKHLKEKNLEQACPKFAESYRLAQRLGTLLNLATCHERQGRTASAWAEFTEAAAMAKAEKRRDREKLARTHADALEKKLSRLVLQLPDAPEDARLELDGNAIGRAAWGTPVPVDPGEHELSLSAPGKKTHAQTVTVAEGPSEQKLQLPALEDAGSDAAPVGPDTPATGETPGDAPAKDAKSGSGSSTLGWVALGVGVVGVGVGSYFGLQTFSKQKDSDDHCDGTACDQTGVDLRDEAKGTATVSTVAFGVGLLGITVGAVLLATSGDSKKESALWFSPAVSPSSGGAHFGGAF